LKRSSEHFGSELCGFWRADPSGAADQSSSFLGSRFFGAVLLKRNGKEQTPEGPVPAKQTFGCVERATEPAVRQDSVVQGRTAPRRSRLRSWSTCEVRRKRVRGGVREAGRRGGGRESLRGENAKKARERVVSAARSGFPEGPTLRSRETRLSVGETAWEEGLWKRSLLFGRLEALKVKAQECCRGETDPAGREGGP
jgi:hypothetical protein